MDTQSTNYKDHHDPHSETCPHNADPENACECKRVVNRKPFRVCRVTDKSVGHGIRPSFVCEVWPDGRLVIREQGRKLRVVTTLGTVYEQCLMRDARNAILAKRKIKNDRKKLRQAARKVGK